MGSCITKDTSVYEPEPLIVKNQQEIYGFTGQKQRKMPRKQQKYDHYPIHRYTADVAALPSYLTLESELDQLERRLTRQRNLSMHLEAEYGTVGAHRTLDAMKTYRRRRYAERVALHYTPHGTYSDH